MKRTSTTTPEQALAAVRVVSVITGPGPSVEGYERTAVLAALSGYTLVSEAATRTTGEPTVTGLPLSTAPEEGVVADLLHAEASLDEARKTLRWATDNLSDILNERVRAALADRSQATPESSNAK